MRKSIWLAHNKDDLHDLGSDDLLSQLSDDILVSILSCLPLKYAAVTSLLSRRWRHLWCQTVRLDFEDMERWNKIIGQRTATFKEYVDLVCAGRKKYINWVDNIIGQHKNPTIDEFKICFNLDKTGKGAIGKWIEFAISKNVQRLELDFGEGFNFRNKANYAFPTKIFDRKRESSLKRSSFSAPVRPYATVMEIKFLKTLFLKRVDVNGEGLKKILSNCPVLEHLFIEGSNKLVKAKINGKGLALKNLEIMYCVGLESIEIRDSNIVSFSCTGSNSGSPFSLRLDNLQMLEKISISDYEMKIDHMLSQISCSIPYLQVLELIIYCSQIPPFPELLKLKQLILEVATWDNGSLSVLTSLAEACPNLQRFTIKLIWRSAKFGLINRQAAKQPHQHLEVVEIDNYHGWPVDLDLVMYFIEYSVALKKLVIKPSMKVGLAANEMIKEENAARNHARRQLEPNTPVGVELVIL